MNDSTTPKINFPLIFAIIAFCSLIVLIVVFFFQRQINRLKKASALEKGGFQSLIHQANEENRRLNQEIERQSNSTPAS